MFAAYIPALFPEAFADDFKLKYPNVERKTRLVLLALKVLRGVMATDMTEDDVR
jgi:hypothetical protein